MQMAMTMGSPPKKGNKKNQFVPIFDFTMKMQMAMTMGSQGVFLWLICDVAKVTIIHK